MVFISKALLYGLEQLLFWSAIGAVLIDAPVPRKGLATFVSGLVISLHCLPRYSLQVAGGCSV